MAEFEKTRLFKIASDINIGKDAIVSFLQNKGFAIENKPTALLSEEMVEVVYDKFKREKKAAEKQREKVDKLKSIKKPGDFKAKPFSTEASHEQIHVSTKIEAEEAVIPEIVPDIPEVHEPTEKIEEKSGPSVGDIIVLPGSKPVVPPPIVKPEEVVAEKVPIKVAEKVVEKVVEKVAEPVQPKVESEEENRERIAQKIKAELLKGESLPEQDLTVFIKDADTADDTADEEGEIADSGEEATGTDEGTEVDDKGVIKHKKKKKRKKIVEVEYEIGDAPKLKGLTIVGKIDLVPHKEIKLTKKSQKVKPVETEEDDEAGAAKAKSSKLKKKGKVKAKPVEVAKDKAADKKKKKKKSVREMITNEDVDKAIRATMSGMGESSNVMNRSKLRQKKRLEREEKELRITEEKEKQSYILQLSEFVSTSDLASLMKVSPNEIIIKCMSLGLMVSINQRLDKDTITLIADDYGMDVEFLDEKAVQYIDDIEEDQEDLSPRSPIVTIMGHVDHGKTSLLDFIRKANVVAGEAGGITQHIGAYRVDLPSGKHITFLDTPGHEAFTAMRARGALVTDIVVLVVAADDSVMPQTIEAISHAQAANVPIVVAINKIDKPDSKPDRIKQQLTDYQVLVEDWGGKNQSVEISAKFGNNVDVLLEKILLEAEMLELKANPDRNARGTVIEAKMDKGLGALSTIIVQKGTLRVGDSFVVGSVAGRVRAMFDERGNKVIEAGPSMPVRVVGLEGLPESGDIMIVVENEQESRSIANSRKQLRREQEFRQVKHVTLDDISRQIQIGGVKELNLIIKGDVGGSVEALSDSLLKLSRDEVRVVILHKGVGPINESDVMLAVASGAVIIGFQVSVTTNARKLVDKEAVDVRLYSIIYDCINEIKLALEGLLSPDMKEEITSTVEVRRTFKISKLGVIAGCYVLSGKITRNDRVRILRDGLPVFVGTLHSLKRNKDDVKEVETGYECGIMLEGYNDLEERDIIEGYKIMEIKRTLT